MSQETLKSEAAQEKSFSQKHLGRGQKPASNTSVSSTQSSRFKKAAAQAERQITVPGLIHGCWTTKNFAEEIKENTSKVQTQASGFCCLLPFPLPTTESQVQIKLVSSKVADLSRSLPTLSSMFKTNQIQPSNKRTPLANGFACPS